MDYKIKGKQTMTSRYEHRQYVVFSTSELDKIDFSQVLETSKDTVRKSIDGSLTFVKWDSNTISECVQALTTKSQYYTHSEILNILATEQWTSNEQEI